MIEPFQVRGGKSGQHREVLLLTATEGNFRDSATETKPPRHSTGKDETSGVRAHSALW